MTVFASFQLVCYSNAKISLTSQELAQKFEKFGILFFRKLKLGPRAGPARPLTTLRLVASSAGPPGNPEKSGYRQRKWAFSFKF